MSFYIHLNERSIDIVMSKKKAILDAVLELITKRGLYDTPMSEVANKANVAAGTIYHYFKNKEALILELYTGSKSQMMEAIIENVDENATYQRQFVKLWKNLYNFFTSQPKLFKFMEQFENSPFLDKIPKLEYEKYYSSISFFLNSGIEQRILTRMLYGEIAAVAKTAIYDPDSVDNQKIIKAIEISWEGFKLKTSLND